MCEEAVAAAKGENIKIGRPEDFHSRKIGIGFIDIKFHGAESKTTEICLICHDNPLIVVSGSDATNVQGLVQG